MNKLNSSITCFETPTPVCPAGFNINLNRLAALRPTFAKAILKAAHAGELDAYLSRSEYWVSSSELADLLAPGDDLNDPLNKNYIPPNCRT